MPPGDGWYLIGPLIAVALTCLIGTFFWRLRPQPDAGREPEPVDGLAIFSDREDFGLLCTAAVIEDPRATEEIRRMLCDAGIRATSAMRRDGRFLILVFGEHVEEARRLVRDSPAL